MAYTAPTVADFKAYFARDFPYGTTSETVMDSDITAGLQEAGFNFNEGLYSSQAKYSLCYLLLAAHYLVTNLQSSSQGIAGAYSFLSTSKSVGSVSESTAIPDGILQDPYLSMLVKTPYGARYISLVLPLIRGNFFAVFGGTHP